MKNNIAIVRKEQRLTQSMLAKMVGISRPCLSEIETGKSTPDGINMIKIANVLGKSVNEIFFIENVV